MSFKFGTKSETLLELSNNKTNFIVPELYYFSLKEWKSEKNKILSTIKKKFTGNFVAIRSSSIHEDTIESSLAGAFRSYLSVNPLDNTQLLSSIESIINSYPDFNESNQILVQKMLTNITLSGVIMTYCISDGAPYYVLNYDDETGRTDLVTGGKGVHKTVFVHRNFKISHVLSERLRKMINLAKDVEKLCHDVPVDIEFAMNKNHEMFLLQARPISTSKVWEQNVDQSINNTLPKIEKFFKLKSLPNDYIAGTKTVFGNMPDWNPAELLGVTARPLSVSLFRKLISSKTWKESREEMGYRKMPEEDLMVLIAGRPYIDVRCSFNSFLPSELDKTIENKIINAWIDRLIEHPEYHDKTEFEIAHTILDFDFNENFNSRYKGVLYIQELNSYKEKLKVLTKNCLRIDANSTLMQNIKKIQLLENLQKKRQDINLKKENPFNLLAHANHILEECRILGTKPFSIIARHAFIAETLLRSAINRNAISLERSILFKNSISTVMGYFLKDFIMVIKGSLDPKKFMAQYGHLRPGTYNVLSLRYADRKDFFNHSINIDKEFNKTDAFVPTSNEINNINKLLLEIDIDIKNFNSESFFEYLKLSIAWREYAKFVFTKSLSDAIETLIMFSKILDMTREELSFLSLKDIFDQQFSTFENVELLNEKIALNKKLHSFSESIRLSYIIRDVYDLYVVPMHRTAPNFITSQHVEGELIFIDSMTDFNVDLSNKVVCIENADPGYDWIFTKGIKALVTKYGGTNSHMAIRCTEINLPAAIGVGEQLYEQLNKICVAEVNCSEKTINFMNSVL